MGGRAAIWRALGVDADTARAWRTGRCPPAMRHVPRIAAVLGVPIETVQAVWQRSRAYHNHTRCADGRSSLSAVERAILRAVADGKTDAEIGAERGRSVQTVKNQIVDLRMKLGAVNRPQMVALAFRRGVLR